MSRLSSFFFLGLMAAASCTPPVGAISAAGYQNNEYGYEIEATSSGAFVDESWQIDNFYRRRGEWTLKSGNDYEVTYALDANDDGKYESSARLKAYDLRLTHKNHDGVIFIKTIPLSTKLAKKRPEVLLARYVDGISGHGIAYFSDDGQDDEREEQVRIKLQRFGAKIESEGSMEVAGLVGRGAIIHISNIDQLQADPEAQGQCMELFVAHTPFVHEVEWYEQEMPAKFPVLMVLAYYNQADAFEEGLEDFHRFAASVTVGGAAGLRRSSSLIEGETRACAPTTP